MDFKATHRVIETQEPVMAINDDPFDWDALEVIMVDQKEITGWSTKLVINEETFKMKIAAINPEQMGLLPTLEYRVETPYKNGPLDHLFQTAEEANS